MRLRVACVWFLVAFMLCMLYLAHVVNAARRLKHTGWGAVLDDEELWIYNRINPKDTWGVYEHDGYARKRY